MSYVPLQLIVRCSKTAALSLALLCPTVAVAQKLPTKPLETAKELRARDPGPSERLASEHTVVARVNPFGLIYFSRLSYRVRLFDSDSPLTKDNYFGIGIAPSASPAFARAGFLLEVQPLSILQLWATYEAVGYFGSFQFFQSFPGVSSNHSDTRLDELRDLEDGDPAKRYSTFGTQLNLGAKLQAKVGPVAARNLTRFARGSYDLREGDRTYYDVLFDVLAPNDGWYVVNDLDLLFVTPFGLTVGARYTMTHAFYEDRHFAEGEDRTNPNTPHHRIGPFFAYTFWDDNGASKFDRPTVLLIVNWWLEHRYRTGQDVSQAFPYAVLGFSVAGDLFSRN